MVENWFLVFSVVIFTELNAQERSPDTEPVYHRTPMPDPRGEIGEKFVNTQKKL